MPIRPNNIRVMGRNYLLSFQDAEAMGDNRGLCDNAAMTIEILEGLHPIEEMDTVIHETLHAVWSVMQPAMGRRVDEEQVVRRTATCLSGVFMDNPDLLTYFDALRQKANQ